MSSGLNAFVTTGQMNRTDVQAIKQMANAQEKACARPESVITLADRVRFNSYDLLLLARAIEAGLFPNQNAASGPSGPDCPPRLGIDGGLYDTLDTISETAAVLQRIREHLLG